MLCCMFKSHRSILVRRLWKLRVHNEARGEEETPEELEFKSVVHSMLKRLKEKQLDTLIQSVEMKGGEDCECVLYPRAESRIGKKSSTPTVICCKMWRWPDITNVTELKRLPCCHSASDSVYECVNPFHWSLLTEPGMSIVYMSQTVLSIRLRTHCWPKQLLQLAIESNIMQFIAKQAILSARD